MSREQTTIKSESASEPIWNLISIDGRRVAVDYTVPSTLTACQSNKEPREISTTPMKCEMQHKFSRTTSMRTSQGTTIMNLFP